MRELTHIPAPSEATWVGEWDFFKGSRGHEGAIHLHAEKALMLAATLSRAADELERIEGIRL